MGYPRRQQVNPHVSGVYHCISRCVRGESLIESPERCRWVIQRLERLTRVFAVDVCDFAVMRNHVHLLLRTHPDLPLAWTDDEVARRWLARPGSAATGDSDDAVEAAVRNPGRISEWRSRLADLGWFHKLWKEPCSRMWNREEDQAGHLWQGRYRSLGCRDESAVLMQAAYILLNPVHCGAESELCDSARTSMGRRIAAIAAAIAAGRFRQGVGKYRLALLEPAMPCDPGRDIRSLPDEAWTERLAQGFRERARRESIALGLQHPKPMGDEPSVDIAHARPPSRGSTLEELPTSGPEEHTNPPMGGRTESTLSRRRESIVPRRMPERPRSGVPRHANPWRVHSAMPMTAACTLVAFVGWIDLKGRIPRPDKPGWIDPSRPRLVDRLVGCGWRARGESRELRGSRLPEVCPLSGQCDVDMPCRAALEMDVRSSRR